MVMMNCRECEPTHECIACVCERLKTRVAELEDQRDYLNRDSGRYRCEGCGSVTYVLGDAGYEYAVCNCGKRCYYEEGGG
jgi:hypothetical protein